MSDAEAGSELWFALHGTGVDHNDPRYKRMAAAIAEVERRLAQSLPSPADVGMVSVSRKDADQAKQAIGVAITLIEKLTGIPIDDMPNDSFTQHIVKARDAFAHALAQTEET